MRSVNSRAGVDIDPKELSKAPQGAYDRTICVCEGKQDADLVICLPLLERVPDVGESIRSISSMLKAGGSTLVFVPCKKAGFARLGLALAEAFKRKILFTAFPSTSDLRGLKSYCHKCTIGGFHRIFAACELSVAKERNCFFGDYFRFFFPPYFSGGFG